MYSKHVCSLIHPQVPTHPTWTEISWG
uniref:Uncharacterized protein n=1 Tax=Anguilla anguilla TaxID=7936 RepID=A0A0E9XPY3_ANGAN